MCSTISLINCRLQITLFTRQYFIFIFAKYRRRGIQSLIYIWNCFSKSCFSNWHSGIWELWQDCLNKCFMENWISCSIWRLNTRFPMIYLCQSPLIGRQPAKCSSLIGRELEGGGNYGGRYLSVQIFELFPILRMISKSAPLPTHLTRPHLSFSAATSEIRYHNNNYVYYNYTF